MVLKIISVIKRKKYSISLIFRNAPLLNLNSKRVCKKLCSIVREIVQLLLCNEASTNVVDHKGAAPLYYAAWRGNVEIVRLLLCHGPSIPNVNHMVIHRTRKLEIYLRD